MENFKVGQILKLDPEDKDQYFISYVLQYEGNHYIVLAKMSEDGKEVNAAFENSMFAQVFENGSLELVTEEDLISKLLDCFEEK